MRGWRSELVWTVGDPASNAAALRHFPDGLLLVEGGRVVAASDWNDLGASLPEGTPVESLPGRILTPGFVDAHIHFPQLDMIASPGGALLDWLQRYTFPAERAFADPAHAREAAGRFVGSLLAHGTTTAMVFGSVHAGSVEALFEAALGRDMRLIAGKCLMDQGPEGLRDSAAGGADETQALIRAWRGRGRLGYAVTPRFALGSSREQLTLAGRLVADNPDVWMQTHLSENPAEIEATRQAFPEAADYLDVYDRFGLVTDRSLFAHAIHLSDRELGRMGQARCACAFCPTSNLFLGSGLFDLERTKRFGVKVALGTDIGAGTSWSLLTTAAEAWKVGQLQGTTLDPLTALYLAGRGGAEALGLADRIGAFEPGLEADFVVLDPGGVPGLGRRVAGAASLAERLFALMVLGDERTVERTYLAGELAHRRA
ncbi:MAG: guanine deaminase [Caulobacter sp.]|nr:guanine deaminase [Caulobacter sp.]